MYKILQLWVVFLLIFSVLSTISLNNRNQNLNELEVVNESLTAEILELRSIISDQEKELESLNYKKEEIKEERDAILQDNYPINNTVLSQPSGYTSCEFDALLKDTMLKGIGTEIVKAEHLHSVNGIFILSVAQLESGHGQSYIARMKNNLFGMNAWGASGDEVFRNAYQYRSKGDSINHFAEVIRNHYLNNGRDNIDKISLLYCELPQHWANKTKEIMEWNISRLQEQREGN
jgi:beta-N-acetylglucosaminidase